MDMGKVDSEGWNVGETKKTFTQIDYDSNSRNNGKIE